MKIAGLLVFIAGLGVGTAIAEDVVVLYGSGTPKNYQTQHFIAGEFQSLGSTYKLVPVYKPAGFLPKAGQKVLVISTDESHGVESGLSSVVSTWADKTKVVLVVLSKGAPVGPVTASTAASDPLGVDALTASTAWDEGNLVVRLFGSDRPREYKMHQEWAKRALALLDARN